MPAQGHAPARKLEPGLIADDRHGRRDTHVHVADVPVRVKRLCVDCADIALAREYFAGERDHLEFGSVKRLHAFHVLMHECLGSDDFQGRKSSGGGETLSGAQEEADMFAAAGWVRACILYARPGRRLARARVGNQFIRQARAGL